MRHRPKRHRQVHPAADPERRAGARHRLGLDGARVAALPGSSRTCRFPPIAPSSTSSPRGSAPSAIWSRPITTPRFRWRLKPRRRCSKSSGGCSTSSRSRTAGSIEQRVELVLAKLNLPSEADRGHAVGRLAAPRAAGPRARGRARPPAARRADQPPRHRRHHLARSVPRRVSGRRRVRHARSRVPSAARDPHRRDRSRQADVVAGRLRDVPSRRRKSGWPTKPFSRRSSTSGSPRRKCGCGRAIKARRTRNEGRVRALMAMRDERAARRERAGVRAPADGDAPSRPASWSSRRRGSARRSDGSRSFATSRRASCAAIASASSVRTAPARRRCCDCCSGELAPDAGEVRRGANVQVAYYDQQREQLDPERTVFDTIGDGNDYGDRQRPVASRERLPRATSCFRPSGRCRR